jgi:SAM-dependent methyltransferase
MTGREEIARAHEYELGHSDRELERLRLQAVLVDPFTRQFFQKAGLQRGMRVLDVGSGGGDTALLAAELVGDEGEVVGVDQSPAAVFAAEKRISAAEKRNISFRQGELDKLEFAQSFDAAVGRYVLMFSPEPSAMLKSVARFVRAGGPMVFHEPDWSGFRSQPFAPLYDKCCDWIVQTFRRVGTNPRMGIELPGAFTKAGLSRPTMELSASIGGSDGPNTVVHLIAELALTMAPVMEQQGVIAPGEINPADFTERMVEEVKRLGSIVVGRSEIGAWRRRP